MKKLAVCALTLGVALSLSTASNAKLITLFEDDAAFVDSLPNQDTPTTIAISSADVYKGKAAIEIGTTDAAATNSQKYNANIAGWAFNIVETPVADTDARWILFAWKKIGGTGIMIQFPDNGAWGSVTTPFVDPPAPGTRRYIAGENATGWSGVQVSADAPTAWTPVIRDLFADFGAFALTGVALTPFNGTGLYDSVYLGASKAEVEAMLAGTTAVEPKAKLAVRWATLKSE